MTAYFLRRMLLMIPTFIGVTMVAFLMTRFVPGGPLEQVLNQLQTGNAATGVTGNVTIPDEALAELKRYFGLDKPWHVAYAEWLMNLARFDLGTSHRFREPVGKLIVERFPVSIYFGLTGFVLAYLVSIPLGIAKALRHGSAFDMISSAIVFVGYSVPGWALGTLLLVFFAGGQFFQWFPLGGFRSTSYDALPATVRQWEDPDVVIDDEGRFHWEKMSFRSKVFDQAHHTFLPVLCYMIGSFASLTILMKNSLMENLGQDYVRTALAKGLTERRTIWLHVLRNSLIPIATGLGSAIGIVMAGSFLIEYVFNIDGMGYLGYNALIGRDYPVVMGILAVNVVLTLLGNIISDFLYAVIDPRIRFE